MKHLIFGLIATVFFGLGTNEVSAQKWIKYLVGVDIKVEFGQNKVINGQRFDCIDGGICKVTVGRIAATSTTNNLPKDYAFFAIDENGFIYLCAHKSFEREEFKKPFTITDGVNIDNESLNKLNIEIRKVNNNSIMFNGVSKGKTLTPIYEGDFVYLKLN